MIAWITVKDQNRWVGLYVQHTNFADLGMFMDFLIHYQDFETLISVGPLESIQENHDPNIPHKVIAVPANLLEVGRTSCFESDSLGEQNKIAYAISADMLITADTKDWTAVGLTEHGREVLDMWNEDEQLD